MIKSTWFLGGIPCPDGDAIRKKVFVEEQKYPLSAEYDNETAKLGRLAVLKEYRGHHLGAELIKELKKRSKALGAKKIYVSAQVYAVPFYEKYGFRAYGKEYLDIHISHMDMDCPL